MTTLIIASETPMRCPQSRSKRRLVFPLDNGGPARVSHVHINSLNHGHASKETKFSNTL